MRIKFSHQDIALIFLLTSIALPSLSSVAVSKLVKFVYKWLLRISMCMFLAFAISASTSQSRPLWVLFIGSILGYGLVESVYIWLMLTKYSALDFPLFATYTHEENRLIWPTGKIFENIRQMLIRNGFKFAATLAVKIESTPIMITPIFYSDDGTIRLQLMFPNIGVKRLLINCALISHMRSGAIFVTHNLQAPISVFYVPPFKARKRQFSTVENLIHEHRKQLQKTPKEAMCLCGENCLQTINGEQLTLEEANIAQGYCERVDGRANVAISFQGRYRLWIKSLLAVYLGL